RHGEGSPAPPGARAPAAAGPSPEPPAAVAVAGGAPATAAEPALAPAEPPVEVVAAEARRHDYGGVLVLESDPTVRAMLASELKAWGRAVFACADGAAVR